MHIPAPYDTSPVEDTEDAEAGHRMGYIQEAVAVVATNVHILVISLLITGLDMGIVRTGTANTPTNHNQPVINLSTSPSVHHTPAPHPLPDTVQPADSVPPLPNHLAQSLQPSTVRLPLSTAEFTKF